MKKRMLILLTVITASVIGCAKAQWQATGGNRSGATVDISYELNSVTRAPDNDTEALRLARERCKAWGYEDAEAFGGVIRKRIDSKSVRYIKTFQCLGQGTEAPRK